MTWTQKNSGLWLRRPRIAGYGRVRFTIMATDMHAVSALHTELPMSSSTERYQKGWSLTIYAESRIVSTQLTSNQSLIRPIFSEPLALKERPAREVIQCQAIISTAHRTEEAVGGVENACISPVLNGPRVTGLCLPLKNVSAENVSVTLRKSETTSAAGPTPIDIDRIGGSP